MTEILTSEIEEAMQRLAGLEHDPAKRAQIIDAATQCAAMGGQSFLDLVDVLGKIMAKASLDAEDMRQLSADGIDIRPAIEQIRRQTLAPFIHRTRLWKDRRTGRWDWSCATCPGNPRCTKETK